MNWDIFLLGLFGSLILIFVVKKLVDNNSSIIWYLRTLFDNNINSDGYFEDDSDESSDSE